ncbi:ABC transporter substrate-binding protein [Nocardioides sp. CFH 31398]|uniref:ABC transporter substrate-binding protein n=1 Tax=Nocardioides sp. CFH 31398 TaxID=2919579 RepID=UPI001F05ECF3|nr:ABC transporter substrate-binding protein [Nocardioides sp. CFH 31398]MCH1865529.1 ABC transporter substrate-binding protein [Nocardioides sp. CFH 31398]
MSRARALVPPVLVLLLAAGLSACGTGGPAAGAGASGAGADPVTVDDCGRDVTVQAPPQRVVSLNQGTTEILLSLGAADRLVRTAQWTDPVLPRLAGAEAGVPRLSDDAPSLESVLAAEPDLVTASFTSTLAEGGVAPVAAFEELGVPAYLSPAECGKVEVGDTDGERRDTLEMETIHTEVRDLAALLGEDRAGEELVADLTDRMDAVEPLRTPDGEPVSVMYWFANAESPYLAGCCGGPGIVSRALGLENVFAEQTADWPQVGWEAVAERDPDVLVLGDLSRRSQTAETAAAKIAFLESHPVARRMTAVREGRYVALAGAELNPSIRTVDAVEKVAAGVRDLGLAD